MEENQYYFSDNTNLNSEELEKMTNVLLKHLLEKIKIEKPISLSCSIVDDETIHNINREYRNIDKPTDVISFAYQDAQENDDEPLLDLGEIVISIETAKRQAEGFNHPAEREVAFLFIHGFLHLMGYDHVNDEKKAEEMFALQNEILNSFIYEYKEIN